MIYISSRDRVRNLDKTMRPWLEQGYPIVIMTEPDQVDAYLHATETFDGDIEIVGLKETNMGLGYSRRKAVEHAQAEGFKSIIVSDDDIYPSIRSDVTDLLDFAEDGEKLGIGITVSYHGLALGNDFLKAWNKPVLCDGGWGFRCYALNVENTIGLGNFDEQLPCLCEDAELARIGIANEIPWYVHCGVTGVSIGKRHEPGGMMGLYGSPGARKEQELECHKLVYERWPKYVTHPSKTYRMAWKKMLNDYIHDWPYQLAVSRGEVK